MDLTIYFIVKTEQKNNCCAETHLYLYKSIQGINLRQSDNAEYYWKVILSQGFGFLMCGPVTPHLRGFGQLPADHHNSSSPWRCWGFGHIQWFPGRYLALFVVLFFRVCDSHSWVRNNTDWLIGGTYLIARVNTSLSNLCAQFCRQYIQLHWPNKKMFWGGQRGQII